MFPVIFKVLMNTKVILAAIVCFMLMDFACYVCNYRKKPAQPKIKKSVAAAAPEPAENGGGEGEADGADE